MTPPSRASPSTRTHVTRTASRFARLTGKGYCGSGTVGVGKAPFSYWQRSLDSYTQIMTVVDGSIGKVLNAFGDLPRTVQQNTVIVFMSDHGEYAGAHGFVSGKVGSLYEEAFHVPLIVVDLSGRFTGDIDTPRQGLTSSVDVLPLLVSLGHGGGRGWLTGQPRPDLRRAARPAADAALVAGGGPGIRAARDDESAPGYYNFNNSPPHLVGVRTQELKFGTLRELAGRHGADRGRLDARDRALRLLDRGGPSRAGQPQGRPAHPGAEAGASGRPHPERAARAAAGAARGGADRVAGRIPRLRRAPPEHPEHELQQHSSSAEDLSAVLPFGQDF